MPSLTRLPFIFIEDDGHREVCEGEDVRVIQSIVARGERGCTSIDGGIDGRDLPP